MILNRKKSKTHPKVQKIQIYAKRQSLHHTPVLKFLRKIEFGWHLTFLFLALETDLRKSHSS